MSLTTTFPRKRASEGNSPRRDASSLVNHSATTVQSPSATPDATASAAASLPEDVIDGGEIILLAIKPSVWRPFFDSGPWLVVCGVIASATLLHGISLPGLSIAATAQLILGVSVARLALALVKWVPMWRVLTNRRVISIQGVRAPQAISCPLVKIQGLEITVSPLEKLTNLGTLHFDVPDHDGPAMRWESIASVEEVSRKIHRAIHDSQFH